MGGTRGHEGILAGSLLPRATAGEGDPPSSLRARIPSGTPAAPGQPGSHTALLLPLETGIPALRVLMAPVPPQVLSEHGFGLITTDIREGQTFCYAEDYHQQYLSKIPNGYCGLGGTGVSCPLAHCFKNKNKSTLEVVHGKGNLDTENLTKIKVDKLITHYYFDSWFYINDIALLLLKSPLNLGVKKVPICLSEVTDIERWRNCWVTGWGTTIPKRSTETALRKVNIQLIEWETCFHTMPLLTKSMLCAGDLQGGKDTCQGYQLLE
ncbi:hypothetical protein J1605_016644 [Eschrichtius robustus]|uniref:peptide-methionine (S)-S-oxide reductase n=1 Tax=Eschrichtius robustus TaxID=9764 RepID=A0AB34I7F9_ESCRO|nr:hypothetical protein J1605_016644 [Eschrichtius robustus]